MSRRRYISTDISTDARVKKLSDFGALLYILMIPHAGDDGGITADPDELHDLVVPSRKRRASDVADATAVMVEIGLLERCDKRLYFPPESFYKYQTYVKAENRRKTPKNTEEHRESPQKAVSVPVPIPVSPSVKEEDHPPHQRGRARPLIFELYENAIGSINPTAAELLKEAEVEYPAPCIEDAFRQAVALNKRSWAYVEAICKRHKAKGNCDDDRPKQPVQTSSRTPSRRSERGAPPDIAEWERYARGDES